MKDNLDLKINNIKYKLALIEAYIIKINVWQKKRFSIQIDIINLVKNL